MKKLMWCSDSPYMPTGYSNQSNYIIEEAKKSYQCIWFSHQYAGSEEMRNGYMHLPAAQVVPGDQPYGANKIDFFVNKYQPDMVAWLCDPFMIPWVRDKKVIKCPSCADDNKKKSVDIWKNRKTLFYFPFDSAEVYEGAKETLESFDYRVAMSKFGQKLLKDETGLDSDYIPHCVDTGMFYPIAQEEIDKLKEQNGLKDKFVIGMVGRNQTRKMPARLLYVFKDFIKDKDDCILFMHCDPFDPMGNNLVQIANGLGIGDKVKFTGVTWYSGFPMQQLNLIYNMMDVHCLTTTGEGYGITTIESLSAGIPNIITDYTTTNELLTDGGVCGIPIKWNEFVNGGYNTRRALPSIPDFVEALNDLYADKDKRKQYGEVGRKKVMKNNSTTVVLPQWTKKFKEVLGE